MSILQPEVNLLAVFFMYLFHITKLLYCLLIFTLEIRPDYNYNVACLIRKSAIVQLPPQNLKIKVKEATGHIDNNICTVGQVKACSFMVQQQTKCKHVAN